MNIQPLLDALDLQEDAARALADGLRAQIDDLQSRLREAETHLEHLAITRRTVTGLADRLPAVVPDLPEHPDYPRILDAFNHATGPLRAKDVCEALGHELLPKNVEGTRAKLKRLVKLGILTEAHRQLREKAVAGHLCPAIASHNLACVLVLRADVRNYLLSFLHPTRLAHQPNKDVQGVTVAVFDAATQRRLHTPLSKRSVKSSTCVVIREGALRKF
ncbi:hypothetical protein ACFQ51_38050 [Streptomyces kaempferi]